MCLAAVGCEKETGEQAPKVIAAEAPPSLPIEGMHPDDFRCELLASLPAVSDALGRIVEVDFSPFPAPTGVPKGCNYYPTNATVGDAGPTPSWSFDLDCRKTALRDAGRLMGQYAADAAAVVVEVGQSGIDHRNTLLLFVDNDTPCYVRVLGPGRENRVALAKVIADGLTPRNVPRIK